MPKIDPFTGCRVMTTTEFFAAEGAREGKTGGEVMSELFDDIGREIAEARQRIIDNPAETLAELQKAVAEYNAADPEMEPVPRPTEILEFLDVQIVFSFAKNTQAIRVKVRIEDGSIGTLSHSTISWGGSGYDPPDYEEGLKWEPEAH